MVDPKPKGQHGAIAERFEGDEEQRRCLRQGEGKTQKTESADACEAQ